MGKRVIISLKVGRKDLIIKNMCFLFLGQSGFEFKGSRVYTPQ
jgi:hypothetical protein